jgi:hypothetical protein
MNTKKVLSLSILSSFMLSLITLVSAAGLKDPVSGPNFFLNFIEFFNLGLVWGDVIVSLVLIAVIFAATWDILMFTSFETKWVKYTIAIGVALVVMSTGVINSFTRWVIALAGGSIAIATLAAIILGIAFFIGGTFFKGKMKALRYKQKANAVSGAMELQSAKVAGDIGVAKAAAAAAEKEARRV